MNNKIKQYLLNNITNKIKKKNKSISFIIYSDSENGLLISYNNGICKNSIGISNLNKDLNDTTIEISGKRLSNIEKSKMYPVYKYGWVYNNKSYISKPGVICEITTSKITNSPLINWFWEERSWAINDESKLNVDLYYFFIKEGHYYNRFETQIPNLSKVFRSRLFDQRLREIGEYSWITPMKKLVDEFIWKNPNHNINLCDIYVMSKDFAKIPNDGSTYFGDSPDNFATSKVYRGYHNYIEALFEPNGDVTKAVLQYGQKNNVYSEVTDSVIKDINTNGWVYKFTDCFAFPLQPYIYTYLWNKYPNTVPLIETIDQQNVKWRYIQDTKNNHYCFNLRDFNKEKI